MKTLIFSLIAICISCISLSQNIKSNREDFNLKLAVDSTNHYFRKVESSPYFIKKNVLKLYTTEQIFLQADIYKGRIAGLNVVKTNKHPKRTITISLSQKTNGLHNDGVTMTIVNPFDSKFKFSVLRHVLGEKEWISDKIVLNALDEHAVVWNDLVISVVCIDWQLLN